MFVPKVLSLAKVPGDLVADGMVFVRSVFDVWSEFRCSEFRCPRFPFPPAASGTSASPLFPTLFRQPEVVVSTVVLSLSADLRDERFPEDSRLFRSMATCCSRNLML